MKEKVEEEEEEEKKGTRRKTSGHRHWLPASSADVGVMVGD